MPRTPMEPVVAGPLPGAGGALFRDTPSPCRRMHRAPRPIYGLRVRSRAGAAAAATTFPGVPPIRSIALLVPHALRGKRKDNPLFPCHFFCFVSSFRKIYRFRAVAHKKRDSSNRYVREVRYGHPGLAEAVWRRYSTAQVLIATPSNHGRSGRYAAAAEVQREGGDIWLLVTDHESLVCMLYAFL